MFARKLTYPEPVTEHNIHEMRQAVINGPHTYPGANLVEYEDGQQVDLVRENPPMSPKILTSVRPF